MMNRWLAGLLLCVATHAYSLDLRAARDILDNARRLGGSVGTIALNGFNEYREVELGKGLRALVISCQGGGGIALFDPDGLAAVTLRTDEIQSIMLYDLDRDGISDLITEQLTQYGTGLIGKEYRIYRVRSRELLLSWSGESFLRSIPLRARTGQETERTSFIHFDDSDGKVVLVYDAAQKRGARRTIRFTVIDGTFRRAR